MSFKKLLLALVLIPGILSVVVGYAVFLLPNMIRDQNLYIDKDDNLDSVTFKLTKDNTLKSDLAFFIAGYLLNYNDETIHTGRYKLDAQMTNLDLIRKLRSGRQDPVRVVIQNGRYINDFAGQLGTQLMVDSTELMDYLTADKFLRDNNLSSEELLTLFIPNSYEFYWDTPLDILVNRLKTEGDKYWSQKNREEKIKELGITKKEAYILASIVEKESQNKEELATIAGLYLNRLNINMPLQADPTVVFAVGNFELRRVLNIHLVMDSPYNTYKYPGLPPGPICMPSLNSLNAVIHPERHNYIYMCAKPGYEGRHLFAESFNQHINNANKYRIWLEQEGIR